MISLQTKYNLALTLCITLAAYSTGLVGKSGTHHRRGSTINIDMDANLQQGVNNSSAEFMAANMKIHEGMNIKFTGDTDLDFVRGMIPHHEGAVEMSKILLKSVKDDQLKDFGLQIIETQEREIEFMRGWLATRETSK